MQRHTRTEQGATSTEYALLVASIAAVIVLAVTALGQATGDLFDRPCAELAAAAATTQC
jgi:Flp pilus assembly pilin Flp